MTKLYQIDTRYACAGIEVKDGVVVKAAPVFQWMLGKTWVEVEDWLHWHGGEIIES